LAGGYFPEFLSKPVRFAEMFGHGIGVAMLLVAVFALDPLGRPKLLRIAAAAFGSGLAANFGKMLVERVRPRYFDLTKGVFDSFVDWFPLFGTHGDHQSFPSSHAATAAGFAVALTWRFPRGRWYFVAMVVLVAMQRYSGNSHFVSDLIFGAAVGYIVGHACLPGGIFSGPFDRYEERMAKAQYASQQRWQIKSNWN
jgi:membrane-associated phospholipid phosphatase